MSDNVSAKELSDAFKYLLSYQLDSIAVDGVMPSAHGALHKLLCSCYSKDTEVVDIYNMPTDDTQDDHYVKTSPVATNKTLEIQPPPAPKQTKKESPIIVEVYDDTPNSKMMLSTVKNPYGGGGGGSNNNNNNNSNHRMVIEDVTDDPEYSSYGNENEKPENEEEGAFVEYEKLDKTEDPAAYKVCHSTRAINRTYNNIRPSYRMPIEGSGGGGGSVARGMRVESMNLSDVEDGARCRDKDCRLGWKQHAWRMRAMVRGMVGRGKKKEKNGVPPPQPPPPPPSTSSTTKHAKIMPSFSCSPPTERKDSKPAAMTVAPTADHSVGSPPARRHPPKRIPSGKSPGNTGVVRTDLAIKVCVHCKSDRSDHELPPNQALNVYNRLGIQPPAGMPQSGVVEQEVPGSVGHGYAWVPPGLSRKKVEEYMSQLPNNVVPRTNSSGEKLREKQLLLQLPRQDLSVAYCRHLTSQTERKVYEEFVNARNEIALDIGYVSSNINKAMECHKCSGILETNEMAVIAPKLGDSTGWHPACFTCQTCEQLLVDLTYCVKDNQIYCERHYAELHKPRCSACDELIFAGEYTKAMNKDWHSDHFCCWQCDQTLTGQRYIMRDEQPYCIKCYEDVFANQCDECAKPIGIDSKDLSYKDKHWHEHCFLCSMCKISLVDMPFGSKNDRIFCSNCYDQAFATRCDGCNEIFRAGMKKMEYKGKQWHDKCFCCAHCKVAIGTKSFIPKNDDVFCGPCYEEKFATRCSKCKKVITAGGVTYKNEPWHRECFCCTNCNSSLAGQRFTSKDEKPYCANCYGELFAKRCNACTKPITGIGGAKFISFEDRHWHNDCFICAQCTTSLVGKGFITDGHEILCPECAKARLMAANS